MGRVSPHDSHRDDRRHRNASTFTEILKHLLIAATVIAESKMIGTFISSYIS
jgi:hypothetical protein